MSAVPPSIRPAVGATEDTAENFIDLAEDVFMFHPKPGGMVDQHRKERERNRIREQQAAQVAERVEERGYQAVKTAQLSPEVFGTQTFTIASGAKRMILPLRPYRFRATVILIQPRTPLDYTDCIVLSKDENNATSGVGAVFPPNIPTEFRGRGQLWAYNPLNISVQVSIVAEEYAPETMQ